MAKRGPKPTPTAILTARGSWRAAVNPGEPQPEPGVPAIPSAVRSDPDALRTWRRVIPKLEGAGVLCKLDGEVLGEYALLRAMRDRAHAVLSKSRKDNPGRPVEQSDAGQKITRQILDLTRVIRSIEAEFGLTPSTRARIVLPSDRTKEKHADGKESKPATSFIRRAG